MNDCNPCATPMDCNIKLEKTPETKSYPEIKEVYQSLIGGLMYAAITT